MWVRAGRGGRRGVAPGEAIVPGVIHKSGHANGACPQARRQTSLHSGASSLRVCCAPPPPPPQTCQGWTVTAKGLWLSHQNKRDEYSSLLGQNDGTRGKGARKVRRRQRTSRDAELDVFTAALVPVWGLMSRLGGAPSLKPTRWHQVGVGTP